MPKLLELHSFFFNRMNILEVQSNIYFNIHSTSKQYIENVISHF